MEDTKIIEEVDEIDEVDLDDLLSSNLIVYNDDHNTFEWVIFCLINILSHTPEQAEQSAVLIHNKGKCQVKSGTLDELKPYKDSLTEKGLSVTIE